MNEGVRSSWKGHRPFRLTPARFNVTKSATTSSIRAASLIFSMVSWSITSWYFCSGLQPSHEVTLFLYNRKIVDLFIVVPITRQCPKMVFKSMWFDMFLDYMRKTIKQAGCFISFAEPSKIHVNVSGKTCSSFSETCGCFSETSTCIFEDLGRGDFTDGQNSSASPRDNLLFTQITHKCGLCNLCKNKILPL